MSVWDCETKRRYVIKKDNRLFFYEALPREKHHEGEAIASPRAEQTRLFPRKAMCDKREQLNCETGFAIEF